MSEKPAEDPTQASGSAAPAEGEDAGPSKKAQKKAEAKAKKEAEKAKRAAEVKEREAAAKAAAGGGEDLAKENYRSQGDITHTITVDAEKVKLKDIGDAHLDKTIKMRAWIQNSRMQGAKMAFVELREERNWSIQGVMAVSAEGKPVSKQMVKWTGGINLESYVLVEAVVKKPLDPVKSCRVSEYELHLTKCYLIASAPEVLGMTLGAANKAVASFEDEDETAPTEAVKDLTITDPAGAPAASLTTHLNNPIMHKRAPVQQAIADIRMTVRKLFAEYLESKDFVQFEPPCLIGAASEGGANVFGLKYFDKQAFLAQSPQFYKQFEIAGGRKRVYCIGPVFRAENSNTPRHMTEFTGLDMEMEIEESYIEVLTMIESLLLYIFRGLEEKRKEEIELIRAVYPSEPFLLPPPGKEVRLTFAEGQKLLREEGPPEYRNVSDHEDMSTPQEKALGALVRKKYNTDFYVLDKFPEEARPFYAMEDPANPKVTNAYDFFMRGQEILSGGQRIHTPEALEARIRKKGVDPKSSGIKEYVDVFRSAGVPPHGGGGIGLDRVIRNAWFILLNYNLLNHNLLNLANPTPPQSIHTRFFWTIFLVIIPSLSLFQCLYSQCDSSDYGPALLHSMKTCMTASAEIHVGFPTVTEQLDSREEEYLAGQELPEVPGLQLRQDSAGPYTYTVWATATVTTTTNGPLPVTIVTHFSTPISGTGAQPSNLPGLGPVTSFFEANSTQATSTRPWMITASETGRHLPSCVGLIVWAVSLFILDYAHGD
ncbi:aspartyl-trna synthetase [Seiridium cupressi]